MEKHETRYSSRLSRCYRALCLRAYLPDPLDDQGRHAARRNLLELPSVFHWEAETRRHRRPRGALQQEICQRSRRCWQEVTAKYPLDLCADRFSPVRFFFLPFVQPTD